MGRAPDPAGLAASRPILLPARGARAVHVTPLRAIMITTDPRPFPDGQRNHQEHEGFLPLLPIVERHARAVFRHLPEVHLEETVAEAVAAAFLAYVRLKLRGRDPVRDFPACMAGYAVLHVKCQRHVGGRTSSKDVISALAQARHGFRVESLPRSFRRPQGDLYGTVRGQQHNDAFEEQLQDKRHWPVPDRAAFRLDFFDFFQTLSRRDRKIVRYLARGHSGKEAAQKFRLTPGRITQLRQAWRREWYARHGEAAPV